MDDDDWLFRAARGGNLWTKHVADAIGELRAERLKGV